MSGRGRGSDRGGRGGGRGRGGDRGRGRGGFGDSRPQTPQQAPKPATPAVNFQVLPYDSVKKVKEVKTLGNIVTGQNPGTKGTPVNLVTNHFPVLLPEGPFAQYDVKFNPTVDHARKANAMLMSFHNDPQHILSKYTYIYDGKAILYSTKKLPEEVIKNGLVVKDKKTGATHKITITFTRAIATKEIDPLVLQLYNNVIRRAIVSIHYQQFGRNFYNMKMAKAIQDYNFKVVPGLLFTLKGVSDNIMLNADLIFRSLRTDTVFDFIENKRQEHGPDYYRSEVERILPGVIVLCPYNNRTVPIHGIDWTKTPASTFTKNNANISFMQYYLDHYEIKIKNKNQPLLVSEKVDKQTGKVEKLYYVPELCQMTGIDDDMRADRNLMKALKDCSGMDPMNRTVQTVNFLSDAFNNKECKQILEEWGISIQPNPVSIQGRVLDKNSVIFGANKTIPTSENVDWQIRSDPLYKPVSCDNWAVACVKGFEQDRDNFLHIFFQVITPLGMKFSKPAMIVAQDKKVDSLIAALEKQMPKSTNAKFLLTILPNDNPNYYNALKKYVVSKRLIINQCVVQRTISSTAKGIHSKVTKLAVQIATKLGGAPWIVKDVKFPSTAMVCGVDVYHSGEKGTKKKHSYVGFTASMDNNVSSYYSSVVKQDPGKEIIEAIEPCFLNSMVHFQKVNNAYPANIFIYRDGVGEGQVSEIKAKELDGVKRVLQKLGLVDKVKICYILVLKRINTRLYSQVSNTFDNPTPGTVVDKQITEPNLAQEFFMVSQHVNQGSASPINYQVILNESNFNSDYIQSLTNKLCHLYYNWFGVIKVPAPCLYAHKIAFLVGQSVQTAEFKELQPFLFYL